MLYYKYILIPVTALQEGVTIMTKRSTKTLKIILFAGMFIWMVKFSLSHGSAMNPDTLVGSVFMASLVYLLATLFGLALSVSNNYIVAIVLTGILAFLFIFKMDELTRSISWLSDELSVAVITILTLVCIARDIIYIKNSLVSPHVENQAIKSQSESKNDEEL
jgi:hypothetical protein